MQASAPEVRDVLAKGVADAVTFPWGSLLLFGIDKVTKYDMDAPLGTVTFQWLMNPATYAAMSPSQKKVIDDHCTSEWAGRFADPGPISRRADWRRSRPSRSHEVYTISDEQIAEWKKSAEPLKQEMGGRRCSKAGGDPDTILKELQASLTKYDAGLLTRSAICWPSRRPSGQASRADPARRDARRATRWIGSSTASS